MHTMVDTHIWRLIGLINNWDQAEDKDAASVARLGLTTVHTMCAEFLLQNSKNSASNTIFNSMFSKRINEMWSVYSRCATLVQLCPFPAWFASISEVKPKKKVTDDLRPASVPLTDDTALFAVSHHDLRSSPGWFTANGKYLRWG